MYLSSMGHTPTYPNCVVVSSLSSGLCIYGVSKLGAWNLGQWGLASWNDNAILEIYFQGRTKSLWPFDAIWARGWGTLQHCRDTTTVMNHHLMKCLEEKHDFIAPKWYIYIYHNFNNNILCQEPAIARSMHGVVLSRYAVRCAPSPFFAGKCELESGWKICMM